MASARASLSPRPRSGGSLPKHGRWGCRSSSTPSSCPISAARRWWPGTAACPPITSNISTTRAWPRWPGRHGRRAPARRVLHLAGDAGSARGQPPRKRRAHGGGDRQQSRHLAPDVASAGHEHGGDAVPPDARGGARGTTRNAARALGLSDAGTIAAGSRADLAVWDVAHPAELSYRLGFNPLHRRIFAGAFQ